MDCRVSMSVFCMLTRRMLVNRRTQKRARSLMNDQSETKPVIIFTINTWRGHLNEGLL